MSKKETRLLQQLAERLHKHNCAVKDTKMCGWYGIDKPWKQGSNFKHNEVYLHQAKQLLSVCGGDYDLADRIIKVLWPTLEFMK